MANEISDKLGGFSHEEMKALQECLALSLTEEGACLKTNGDERLRSKRHGYLNYENLLAYMRERVPKLSDELTPAHRLKSKLRNLKDHSTQLDWFQLKDKALQEAFKRSKHSGKSKKKQPIQAVNEAMSDAVNEVALMESYEGDPKWPKPTHSTVLCIEGDARASTDVEPPAGADGTQGESSRAAEAREAMTASHLPATAPAAATSPPPRHLQGGAAVGRPELSPVELFNDTGAPANLPQLPDTQHDACINLRAKDSPARHPSRPPSSMAQSGPSVNLEEAMAEVAAAEPRTSKALKAATSKHRRTKADLKESREETEALRVTNTKDISQVKDDTSKLLAITKETRNEVKEMREQDNNAQEASNAVLAQQLQQRVHEIREAHAAINRLQAENQRLIGEVQEIRADAAAKISAATVEADEHKQAASEAHRELERTKRRLSAVNDAHATEYGRRKEAEKITIQELVQRCAEQGAAQAQQQPSPSEDNHASGLTALEPLSSVEMAALPVELQDAMSPPLRAAQKQHNKLQEHIAVLQSAPASSKETQELTLKNCTWLRADIAKITGERDSLQAKVTELLLQIENNSRGGQTAHDMQTVTAAKEQLEDKVAALLGELNGLRARLIASESHRRELHDAIQKMKGTFRVFCRIRPEGMGASPPAVIPILDEGSVSGMNVLLTLPDAEGREGKQRKFTFDRVFGPNASQHHVFVEVHPLIQLVLDGQKVCIFAYGQTGSGKTYTMLGDALHPGIISRAMEMIFRSSADQQSQGWSFSMKVSMMEIHNEEYKDLLGKDLPQGTRHKVVHDDHGNTTVSELTCADVSHREHFDSLMVKAMSQRSVGATAVNAQSSRSHLVFTLHIQGVCTATGHRTKGVLNLIDLAGSERLSESLAQGERRKETQSINSSLSALGAVFRAIGKSGKSKAEHVNYRDSELTWYLKPCLGGNAKTLMIVNVAPGPDAAKQTLNSLRFASEVNDVAPVKKGRSSSVKK